MKINIKNILDEKKGKGDRWLAEAVEEAFREEISEERNRGEDVLEKTDQVDVQEQPEPEYEEALECEAEKSSEDEAAGDMAVSEDVSEPVEAATDENKAGPTDETEILEDTVEEDSEPEKDKESEEKLFQEEKKRGGSKKFLKRYGWIGAMTAAFVILMLATFVYTSLIPREVYATINDKEYKVVTKEYTIEEFLEAENIRYCEEDYISKPVTTYIYDGIEFKLKHATDFKVTADGKTKRFKTLKRTVGEALADCGVKVNDVDIVTPVAEMTIGDDMNIVVQRVTSKQETVEEKVPFKTKKKEDSSINEGTSKVVTKGVEGVDKVTYEITYIDGKESSKKEVSRTTVKKPVDEVVAKGTKINFNGRSYSKKLVVKAYAYTGGGRTAMGTKARVGEIAVDPRVIPLGKNVYIEGVGARRAEDTGGNIKGNTIDIYMNSERACRKWGVRYVTIYIE